MERSTSLHPFKLYADLYASRAVSLAVFTRRRLLAQSVTQMDKAQHSEKNDTPTAAYLHTSPQIVQYIGWAGWVMV